MTGSLILLLLLEEGVRRRKKGGEGEGGNSGGGDGVEGGGAVLISWRILDIYTHSSMTVGNTCTLFYTRHNVIALAHPE